MADEPTTTFAQRMTETEALMWHVEKDPWFSSTIGTLLVCDRPLDHDLLRQRMAKAVTDIPRMRERVVEPSGRLKTPVWRTDPEFELDYHVRQLALAAPGDRSQLLELATRLMQDPFDRTRPLWQFAAIDGVDGDRGALLVKLHHAITDGQGGIRLARRYMDPTRETEPLPDVDLHAVIAEAVAAEEAEQTNPTDPMSLGLAAFQMAEQTARKQFDFVRKLTEGAFTLADPTRLPAVAESVGASVRTLVSQLSPGQATAHSPLWTKRSRRRHLEVLSMAFAPAKAAAEALGGSLNDLFVTGAVGGAARYHAESGSPVEQLTISFIVSTRTGRGEGGNAFTPSKAVLPAGGLPPAQRFAEIHDILGSRREEVSGAGLLNGVAGLANLLPTGMATHFARSQAAGIDFATSNVRAAPFDVYIGGAKALASYPIGPVAGTAWNITLMSYAGQLHLGVHIDPDAVADVKLLMRSLVSAYEELLAAGGQQATVSLTAW